MTGIDEIIEYANNHGYVGGDNELRQLVEAQTLAARIKGQMTEHRLVAQIVKAELSQKTKHRLSLRFKDLKGTLANNTEVTL